MCDFCQQLESDDVSELNDSMNIQQSTFSCAVDEMLLQQVFSIQCLFFYFVPVCL